MAPTRRTEVYDAAPGHDDLTHLSVDFLRFSVDLFTALRIYDDGDGIGDDDPGHLLVDFSSTLRRLVHSLRHGGSRKRVHPYFDQGEFRWPPLVLSSE